MSKNIKRVLETRDTGKKGLEEQRNDLMAEIESLVTASEEEKRSLTKEEIAKFDELKSDIESIDATLKKQEEARSFKPGDKKRKKEKEERSLEQVQEEELRAAMNTGTTGEGGLVVGENLSKEIITELKDRSAVYDFFDNTSLPGDYKMLVKTESGTAEWVGEKNSPDSTSTATIPKLKTETLKQHRLYRESAITQQMLNSEEINLTQFIKDDIAESMVDAVEDAIFNGTGTGQPTGIIVGITKKHNLAVRGSLKEEDLKRAKAKIKKKGLKGAKWFMHSDTLLELDLIKDVNGRPLLQPDLTKESDYTILGLPVEVSDALPTLATAGAKCVVVLANKSAYHTNTQKQISLNTYDDSMYKRAGLVGYGSDVFMDGKPKNTDVLVGIFNKSA